VAAGVTWSSRTTSVPWAARYAHTSVVDATGAIYVIGGYNSTSYFNDVLVSTDGGVTLTRAGLVGWGTTGGTHGQLEGTTGGTTGDLEGYYWVLGDRRECLRGIHVCLGDTGGTRGGTQVLTRVTLDSRGVRGYLADTRGVPMGC
jgi:hypothetical protein